MTANVGIRIASARPIMHPQRHRRWPASRTCASCALTLRPRALRSPAIRPRALRALAIRLLALRAPAVLTLALLALAATTTCAQEFDATQTGRTFIIAFPDTVGKLSDPRHPSVLRDTFALYIYSAVDNACTITGNGGYRRELDVKGGAFTTVWLDDAVHPSSDITVREVGEVSRSTFRIEAREPVFVICYMATRFGSEAWVPLPVERWGREYVAMAMPGHVVHDILVQSSFDFGMVNKMAPAFAIVVAAFDGTTVHIAGGRSTVFHELSDTVVTLAAGEAYMVRTWVDTLEANVGADQPDITGTRIRASAPVSVISGNVRACWYSGSMLAWGNTYSNLNVEALASSEQHGTTFVMTPARDSRRSGTSIEQNGCRDGDVMLAAGSTGAAFTASVTLNGVMTNDVDDDDDQFRMITRNGPIVVRSTPAQVVQFPGRTVRYEGVTRDTGHYWPAVYTTWSGHMAAVTPLEQWTSFAPFVTPTYPDSMEHFVTVVADSVDAGRIFWSDGRRYDFNGGVIAGTPYVWGSDSLDAGATYTIVGLENARFAGSVYGFRHGSEEWQPLNNGSEWRYLETTALSYGYPLAPARRQLREPTHSPQPPSVPAIELAVTTLNDRITVHYQLPRPTHVRIDLVDILGRIVATLTNDDRSPGNHTAWIDSEGLPTGTYICRLIAYDQTRSIRIAR
jgi:hypothetical protein